MSLVDHHPINNLVLRFSIVVKSLFGGGLLCLQPLGLVEGLGSLLAELQPFIRTLVDAVHQESIPNPEE